MHPDIQRYNETQHGDEKAVCEHLAQALLHHLPESTSKVWHGHPVWFLDDNPIAGYDVLKNGVRLLFWSGQSFDEPLLQPEGSFKAAEIRYTHPDQINHTDLERWLAKAQNIQWDYKNIVKRRGILERLK